MEVESQSMILSDDTANICRVCLTSDKNNQYIFCALGDDLESPDTYNLSEKLRLCGGVEILEDDGLPAGMCAKCVRKINDAHELRKQCQVADERLREMYGKLKKRRDADSFVTYKDEWCQTDYFLIDSIKFETCMGFNGSDVDSTIVNSFTDIKSMDDQRVSDKSNYEDCRSNDQSNKQNVVKCKPVGHDKSSMREAYRTRRTTMFKLVTSMENLKNHKEWQRQYIKKNLKRDSSENNDLVNVKDSSGVVESTTDSRDVHVCEKCSRCYSSKKSLDRHVLTHDEKKFTCEKCDKQFFQLEKLQQHGKLHRAKEKPKPVLCKICNKNFRKTDTMVRHLNAHKRANPKEVLSILKEIRDKRKLENVLDHRERVCEVASNGEKKLSIECEKNEVTSALEKYTMELDHKTSNSYLSSNTKLEPTEETSLYRCKYCTKRYATEKSLERHVLIHNEKKFVCNVCNMKFFRQDRLKSHKSRYGHDEDKMSVEVQKPSDEKSAIKLINSWIREELDSDNEGKGFPCKVCGKSYDTKKSLSKHQQNVHDAQEEGCPSCGEMCICAEKSKDRDIERSKTYRCDECNKSFEKEVKLQRHLRSHERAKEQQDANFKRFLCHICSKTFRQNTGLMFHMRTHTGYKPHVCKYCGRGFTSNSNCINHERTHTGDRPFVCHFCSAAFAKSCTLKAHITTHTGEANYHCKTCGKSFRRLKYLKEHRFTHTGEKPYACKICGTAYSHSGSLFVHEKKCKAQYNNYQSNSAQNTQSYSQPQTSSPSVSPIITLLPQSHLNTGALQTGKTYIDNMQRMNLQSPGSTGTLLTPDLNDHSNSDISDVSSAVRSFALIGQMFQS